MVYIFIYEKTIHCRPSFIKLLLKRDEREEEKGTIKNLRKSNERERET